MTFDTYGVAMIAVGAFLAGCISMICGCMFTVAYEDYRKAQMDKLEKEL